MTVETLHGTFVYELQQAYYIETELVEVLSRHNEMDETTADDDITNAFQRHQLETAEQPRRLEDVFRNLDDEEATLKELEGVMSGSTIQRLFGRLTG